MRRTLAAATAALVFALGASALEPALPRHPALSPDGGQLAFSWQGDLWLAPAAGGAARRLTANPGYDARPLWLSGDRLVFTSDRDGSDDLFLLDLQGEGPRRLTFHESAETPQGPAGKEAVYFTAGRHEAWDRMPAVYRLPLAGGTEARALPVLALEAVPSPDGRRLALVRGGSPASRRHYRGSANRDLWLYEVEGGAMTRLTDTPFDEDSVSWAGPDALVYRTDGGGADRALVRLDLPTGQRKTLAAHPGLDVREARASADGRLVAYALWDALWTVPSDGSAAPRRLSFEVPADAAAPAVERETLRSGADEVAVSPDGTQVALVLSGDVWVVARRTKDLVSVADPPTVQVTRTAARERHVAWSPDGKSLVYASDREGRLDLFALSPADRDDGAFHRARKFKERRLTQGPGDASAPRFSPDGKTVAFKVDKGGLGLVPAAGGEVKVLFRHWENIEVAWSPDSRWLAFSREDADYNSEVFVMPAAGGEAVNLSRHPREDTAPVWSPDGRRLYWLTRRHARTADIWGVYLRRADDERTKEEWLLLLEDEGKKDKDKGKDKDKAEAAKDEKKDEKKEDKKAPKPVVIDFEDIHLRARPFTELPGDEAEVAVAPDGQWVVFTAQLEEERDLYKIRWDGKELERLTKGGTDPRALSFSKDGKTVFYRTGKGAAGSVSLEGKTGDPMPFAARVVRDVPALRAQVFDEAWRELDRWFYDPAFHGADWAALRGRYRPLALSASCRRDYDDAVNWMLGELNASHMAFVPPRNEGRTRTGDLGVEVAPDPQGVKVVEVLPETPASRAEGGLKVGEVLTAVDGVPCAAPANFFDLMRDTSGRAVLFTVQGPGGSRDMALTPVTSPAAREARYRLWVRERRAMTEALSGGKLGYIHIQGMDTPSLEEFERDLFAACEGKQGLLIDVRNNGGGWTADYLMAILAVRRHAYTVPRDGDPDRRAYPSTRLPNPAWTRPAAVLCDAASYSNAEIFSWAFKTLKRGPVVGEATFGAVVSTGAADLGDGSYVRLPMRGWYVAGSGVNQENNGCPPDVVVVNPPSQDLSATEDVQLAKAVEVLLGTLPADPADLPW